MTHAAFAALTALTILGGTIQRVTMPAPALQDPHRSVRVYLPPSYFHPDAAARRYPVVYLLNGSPGSDGDWFGKGKAAVTVDSMIARGAIPEVILVCPNGGGRHYLSRPLYIDSYDGRLRMEEYIVHEVVAWTDSVYRTRAEPRDRAAIGLSDGATGAINLAFHHPDIFGAGGGHSGRYRLKKGLGTGAALGPEPGRSRLLTGNSPILEAPRLAESLRSQIIYFDVGLSDSELEDNRALDRTLDSLGVAHTYREFPGSHRWSYWRVHLHDSLLALTAGMR
jgi:enterochelin esterase-like enzyme